MSLKDEQYRFPKEELLSNLAKTHIPRGKYTLDVDDKEQMKMTKVKNQWVQKEAFNDNKLST